MGLFGKKKNDDAGDDGKDNGNAKPDNGFRPDLRKSRPWLERAHSVADTGNYDYAIDCFVTGLRFDPENMKEHEALLEVALHRHVGGGKAAGFKEKMGGGKTIVEKLVHAEKIWAKDPHNVGNAKAVMKLATEAHAKEENLDLGELVVWVGEKVLQLNAAQGKKGSKSIFVEVIDYFEQVGAYGQAVESCRRALMLTPDDAELLNRLKNLDAEKSMADARLSGKEGGYKEAVKGGIEEQRDRDAESAAVRTEEQHDRVIARAKEKFEEKPDDLDLLLKYVRALVQKGSDESEEEAIQVLEKTYDQTNQYRLMVDVGDIRMRQMNRHIRMVKEALDENANDESLKRDLEDLRQKQLEFETAEYADRTKHYPTDMKIRFEYGRRLLAGKEYEAAVEAFQEAQTDPKRRVPSKEALGMCYIAMEWLDAAIDTLREAIDMHPFRDDRTGLAMRYLLVEALEKRARRDDKLEDAQQALSIASEVLQINIRYRDVRERVNTLKELGEQIKAKAEGAAAPKS